MDSETYGHRGRCGRACTGHRSLRDSPAMAPTRIATSLDASAIAADIAEGFAGYRAWAPSSWQPPVPGSTEIAQFADALTRRDVWRLLALEGDEVIGHVGWSRSTREDPGPPPAGTVYVWQLFVRPSWQGRGIAKQLMQAAVTEAAIAACGCGHHRVPAAPDASMSERAGLSRAERTQTLPSGCRPSSMGAACYPPTPSATGFS